MQRDQLSILVVDDDEATRYTIARILRSSGFKTMEAVSGAEALEFAAYVSAVILDIHLPDLIGWEVCRLLRSNPATAKLPIIHHTARYTSGQDRAESIASGADVLFTSPVDGAALVQTLDRLLRVAPMESRRAAPSR